MLDNAGIKRIMIPGDAQGRPEGCIGRGNVESVGPTPTRPPIRAVPFVFEANAAASRRPRVGPGRPQGTNPRGLSIPWLASVHALPQVLF